MRIRHALAAVAAVGSIVAITTAPAQAAEYSSALKVRGVQYNAPGSDSNRCWCRIAFALSPGLPGSR
jgi:hypothetical protein